MGNWCNFSVCRSVALIGVAAAISGCSTIAIPDIVTPVKRALEPLGRSFDTRTYVVQPGDNLAYIAWRYKASVDELLAWNGLTDASTVVPGQPLQVRGPRLDSVIARAPVLAPATAAPAPQPHVSDTVTAAASSRVLDSRLIVPVTPQVSDPLIDQPNSQGLPVPQTPAIVMVEPVVEPVLVPQPVVEPTPAPAPTAVAQVDQDIVEVPTASRGGLQWAWPQEGKIVKSFSGSDPSQQGIDIVAGKAEPIRAAADGIVAFAGNEVNVLGRTIVIDHQKEFLSAYAKVGRLLVEEGDNVRVGDVIAETGSGGGEGRFHFQIRQKGVPLNPLKYLPKGN